MDPLQLPLISKYEWEYKNDINQRMRVPDKLVAASLPDLDSTGSLRKDIRYQDPSLAKVEHPETTPGYTPDLLTDGEAQNVPATCVTATANATASATVQSTHGTGGGHSVAERFRTAETRLGHLETYVGRLSSRLRAVEQHQVFLHGIIVVYIGIKVIRFVMTALFK